MELDPCECVRCLPPKRRNFRCIGPRIVAVEALPFALAKGGAPESPAPLFLLERLAHIRTFCLSLRAPRGGAPLERVDATVQGSCVAVRCHAGGAPSYCVQLDVGEELDVRPRAASCAVSDGIAYLRLPLAPLPPPPPAGPAGRAGESAEARAQPGVASTS